MNIQHTIGRSITKNTWLVLSAAGILLIVMGVLAMLHPVYTYLRLIQYIGPGLIANSFILLFVAFQFPKQSSERGWMLLKSAIDLVFALILAFNPLLTFIAFPVLAGPLIICSGVVKMIGGAAIRKNRKISRITFSTGVVFVLFGIVLLRSSFGPAMNRSSILGLFAISLGIVYLFHSLWMLLAGTPLRRMDARE